MSAQQGSVRVSAPQNARAGVSIRATCAAETCACARAFERQRGYVVEAVRGGQRRSRGAAASARAELVEGDEAAE